MTDLKARLSGRAKFLTEQGGVKTPGLLMEARARIAELEARPGVTVDVEALAAILWREQAVDVGAPLSVSAGRTHEEFAKQSPETRAPFLKYAKAALRALTGEPS